MVGKEPVLGLDPTGKLYAVLDALCYIGYVNLCSIFDLDHADTYQ